MSEAMKLIIFIIYAISILASLIFLAAIWFERDKDPPFTRKTTARITLLFPIWLSLSPLLICVAAIIGLGYLIRKLIRMAFAEEE